MPTRFEKTAPMLAIGLLLMRPLAGCANTTATGATSVAMCDQFKPISWSSRDTDETIAGVKAHNAVHKAICR